MNTTAPGRMVAAIAAAGAIVAVFVMPAVAAFDRENAFPAKLAGTWTRNITQAD